MAEKTDWSFLDNKKFGKSKKEEEEKPLAVKTGNTPADRSNVDELIGEQNEKLKKQIARQEYEKVKSAAEKFRREHSIQKTEQELAEEDKMLREKFGIEE